MIRTLPVNAIADEIQKAYDASSVLIVTGDPGSGKSTQIPQIIWDHNPRPIIITQPRRLAAIEMAKRVSYEMKGGAQVDYTVRFEDTATEKTQVHFVTDGVLLRLMLENQLFDRYATIIIDEVHERTIFIDLILFLMKKHLDKMSNIKLILMSATIEVDRYARYFAPLKASYIPIQNPRVFKLEIVHMEKATNERSTVAEAVEQVISLHLNEPFGDILVFLPGSEECLSAMYNTQKRLEELLQKGVEVPSLQLHVLFGSQAVQDQKLVFIPVKDNTNTRKVIFATNIAETSLTIENVAYVVDSGLVKQTFFNKDTGTVQLKLGLISQAQAVQRAGRAGRTRDGKCIRLYSKYVFYSVMNKEAVPEVKRAELRSFILIILGLGVVDFQSQDFIEPPEQGAIRLAVEQLYSAGIIRTVDESEIHKNQKDSKIIHESNSNGEKTESADVIITKDEIRDQIRSKLMERMLQGQEVSPITKPQNNKPEEPSIIYFKLTKIGKLALRFPIDPLFTKSIFLGKVLKNESTIITLASVMSTTENLMNQNFEDKKKYYQAKLKYADFDGDFYTFQNLKDNSPMVFHQKALENISKIEEQLSGLLSKISTSKLKRTLKEDPVYRYYKRIKKLEKLNVKEKTEFCLKTSFSIYLAKKSAGNKNEYRLGTSNLTAVLDSESVFEIADKFPEFVLGTIVRGEGQVGVPVITDVIRIKNPDLCFEYIHRLQEIKDLEDKLLWASSGLTNKPSVEQKRTEQGTQQKLDLAREKYLQRKKIKQQ